MKPRVPMITAAAAAITLALGSCSDDRESATPTGPSAITQAAEAPGIPRTTEPATASPQLNGEITGTGNNWQDSGPNGTLNYTYIPGVPGTPQHVRVRPTGRNLGQSYEIEVSWEPPNWGPNDAHEVKMEVVDGQTVITSGRTSTIHPPIESPVTTLLETAEGRFHMSLCNDVGCGPPWDAGEIVIGDAMEKPGPPEMTIEPGSGIGGSTINGRTFEKNFYTLVLNWRNTDFTRKVQLEYWVRHARKRTTTKLSTSVQGHTARPAIGLIEGNWTITARLRNSRGWGRRAVVRLDVQVDSGTGTPSPPRNVSWSNGRLSWEAPFGIGGLPILKYEYFYAAECPAGTGTPYPLNGNDRYYLVRQEIRIGMSPLPDEMSVRAHNRKGASDCVTAR